MATVRTFLLMDGLYPGSCFARAGSDPASWVLHVLTP